MHMPAFLFICNGKLWEAKTGDLVPGICGKDFNHVPSLRKIRTGHSKEGLSLKGKTVNPDPNSRQMSSPPLSSVSLSDFAQSKRD